MKKAFTLAEVLITLAVIGVVAALTIPVLVQKYQKKQLYSQFMKTYNTISTLMDNAIAEYGEPADWNWGEVKYNNETGNGERISNGDDPFNNYFLPLIKYVKKCDDPEECFATEYVYLGGSDGKFEYNGEIRDFSMLNEIRDSENINGTVVLADGAVILVKGNSNKIQFIIDTNGKKGPNVYGRDVFIATYYAVADSYHRGSEGMYFREYDASDDEDCNPNSEHVGNGDTCASRLLQEGAMNY